MTYSGAVLALKVLCGCTFMSLGSHLVIGLILLYTKQTIGFRVLLSILCNYYYYYEPRSFTTYLDLLPAFEKS